MSVEEMKKVINQKVERLSSLDDLDFVLNVLNKIDENQIQGKMDIDHIYQQAVMQYGTVLKKLAE